MEKHAMALGYFFLAAFCVFASGHPVPLRLPLFLAGWAAALVGMMFFVSACAARVQAVTKVVVKAIVDWFVETAKLIPLARELPPHQSTVQEDHLG